MIRFRFAPADPSVHLEELDTLGDWRFLCSISLVDYLRLRHPSGAQAAEMDEVARRIRNDYSDELRREIEADKTILRGVSGKTKTEAA